MKTVIVLAMHGAPPNDFPKNEIGELFGLHARLEHASEPERAALERRHQELEAKMRAWPRTSQNDPFFVGSLELASQLSQAAGLKVIVGFNEFCAPTLDEAFDQAIKQEAERVVVVTPMMTRGGEHSEVDIPNAIKRAQATYPNVEFIYVWPFDGARLAQFLAGQVSQFLEEEVSYGTRTG
ncbi:MAG: CbiX/SirB N-terminal domain-containing protein [Chloroflexi bacterium]|nr:CbiX/SirB N-terminal domain-containing protein [Chloroflexota bacterium]